MNTNPYQTPAPQTATEGDTHSKRASAQRRLRISIAVLMLGAVFNVVMFSWNAPRFFLLINLCGTAIAGLLACFLAVPLLERLSQLAHRFLSKSSSQQEWLEGLYATLMTTLPFAFAGAILWAVWAYLFYVVKANFYAVSIPIGICAHLLSAGVYSQLAVRWWKIEKRKPILGDR